MIPHNQLSFQLYSARELQPLGDQLKLLSEIGYRRVEPFGGILAEPEKLKAVLDEFGLSSPSTHIGVDRLTKEPDDVIAIAGFLGVELVVAPSLPIAERPVDVEGWSLFGKRLDEISKRLGGAGLRFGWHNHQYEFDRISGDTTPMEILFDAAPDMVWEADLAWLTRADEDPISWLDRYKGRVAAVHVKDIAREGEAIDEGGWADLGHGIIDWQQLLPAATKAGATLFVLEHDKPNDVERFARRSFNTCSTL